MRALLCFGLVVPLTACSAEGLGDEAGSAELALDDADPIAAFYRSRAALYRANDSECTATRIASRYFITAAHCNPYACDRTSACKAFSRRKATKQCTLLSSVGGVTDADAYQSALK
jgi:hypothetical protein